MALFKGFAGTPYLITPNLVFQVPGHYVYTLYSATIDRPLYVGVTSNLYLRMKAHRQKPWGAQIEQIVLREFEYREDANYYERYAIQETRPLYNIAGVPA